MEWIKFSEKLPDQYCHVLVIANNTGYWQVPEELHGINWLSFLEDEEEK